MRKRWKAVLGIWLAGAVVMGTGQIDRSVQKNGLASIDHICAAPSKTASPTPTTQTDTDQSRLSQAQKRRDDLETEKKKVEDQVDRIQKFTDNVEKYVKTLDAQMNRLLFNIETNKGAIKNAEEEVKAVNEEYNLAQQKQQEQYYGMKARIKYMYENSEDSYLQFLMESRSLADLFSREEYIEKITSYDKNLLDGYQSILNEVTVAKQRAEDKLDEVEAARESLRYEKKTIKRLMEEKNRQVELYQGMAQNGQQSVTSYSQQISSLEQEIEAMMQQQRDEISAQEANSKPQVVPTTGEYAWPLTVSGRITSNFGYRTAPTAGASSYHRGIDIAVSMGTPVLATKAGKVVTATYSSSAGNYVAIYHGGGIYSYYMHCSSLSVSVGDKVKQGQVIAKSGSTGISTGPHLHFAIYKGGQYVNPRYYVSQP